MMHLSPNTPPLKLELQFLSEGHSSSSFFAVFTTLNTQLLFSTFKNTSDVDNKMSPDFLLTQRVKLNVKSYLLELSLISLHFTAI